MTCIIPAYIENIMPVISAFVVVHTGRRSGLSGRAEHMGMFSTAMWLCGRRGFRSLLKRQSWSFILFDTFKVASKEMDISNSCSTAGRAERVRKAAHALFDCCVK